MNSWRATARSGCPGVKVGGQKGGGYSNQDGWLQEGLSSGNWEDGSHPRDVVKEEVAGFSTRLNEGNEGKRGVKVKEPWALSTGLRVIMLTEDSSWDRNCIRSIELTTPVLHACPLSGAGPQEHRWWSWVKNAASTNPFPFSRASFCTLF